MMDTDRKKSPVIVPGWGAPFCTDSDKHNALSKLAVLEKIKLNDCDSGPVSNWIFLRLSSTIVKTP